MIVTGFAVVNLINLGKNRKYYFQSRDMSWSDITKLTLLWGPIMFFLGPLITLRNSYDLDRYCQG